MNKLEKRSKLANSGWLYCKFGQPIALSQPIAQKYKLWGALARLILMPFQKELYILNQWKKNATTWDKKSNFSNGWFLVLYNLIKLWGVLAHLILMAFQKELYILNLWTKCYNMAFSNSPFFVLCNLTKCWWALARLISGASL